MRQIRVLQQCFVFVDDLRELHVFFGKVPVSTEYLAYVLM